MDIQDIKELGTEIYRENKTLITIGVIFILWSAFMGSEAGCYYQLPDNQTWVLGNCGELQTFTTKYEYYLTNWVEKPNLFTNMNTTMGEPQFIITTEHTTTTTTTLATLTSATLPCPPPKECKECVCTCPVCTITACPEPDYQEVLDEVNLWRPKGAPAVQHGWFQMRDRLRVYLGGTASKFREGPSINYRPITTREETVFQIVKDEKDCFTLEQYPDNNSRKRWNWNKNDCQTSNITICHL